MRRSDRRTLAMSMSAAIILMLAGCATPGSATGPTVHDGASGTTGAPQTLSAQLAGRAFLLTSIRGHELAPGSTIRIEFRDDGAVSANAGCNSMGGTARWDGSVLAVSNMFQTEMACDAPLMDQERWFSDLLTSGVTVTLAGNDLRLTANSVTLDLLDRTVADPDRPLVGTT